MLTRIFSAAVLGVDAFRVVVEVDQARGLPNFATVGLPEGAVKESRVRVESALKNSGLEFPQRRITVNLAPADVRKAGSAYDLPMALGVASSLEELDGQLLENTLVVGELGLDGEVRRVPGAMSMAVMASEQKMAQMICPAECAAEAAVVGGIDVLPARTFRQVLEHFARRQPLSPLSVNPEQALEQSPAASLDFSDVRGQAYAKRALEVAAAGGHNILMLGPPGSGKTMLARRLPSILPALTFAEAVETTKIYSIMGLIKGGAALVSIRPFRAPHHTVSDAGLVGGGNPPRPGEVSLAHNGVLFLDELLEFRRHVLEVLRQPLEDDCVTISRAQLAVTFPARLMLVAAMNPCPCGYLSDPTHVCLCTAHQVQAYRGRISGPLLDRIDIQIEVPAVPYREMISNTPGESSARMRQRVLQAREIQRERFSPWPGLRCNARMPPALVQKLCRLDSVSQGLLENAVRRLGFSARAVERVLKVARTIADLESAAEIRPAHVAEAIQYRSLDRAQTNS